MYKALIIGCGNIGAMYDFESESISTYAKAFHLDPEIEFEVYDIDPEISSRVAKRYAVSSMPAVSPATYQDYDIVVISTSTPSHFKYLEAALERGTRLVICEKPVDTDRTRLRRLVQLYRKSNTRVMVNLFRRFQPAIIQLKQHIGSLLAEDHCTNIVVSYQRGFHNNAIHAIDLLEFLFGSPIDFAEAKVNHDTVDAFDSDPTLSVSCEWHGANLQLIGLANVQFSYFDIAIYFSRSAVLLKDCGNEIELLTTPVSSGNFYPSLSLQSRQEGVLEDYMVNVLLKAKNILKEGVGARDNFLESVSISDRILELQGH